MNQNVIIDIGSNHGEFSLEVARRNPANRVIAIEPIPGLAEELRVAADAEGLGNHELMMVAVGSNPGQKPFNVSSLGDSGISSLLDLDLRGIAADDYWRHREDLCFSSEITVDVVTLERIILELNVDRIDFLKIDAQGLDLDVLASAQGTLALVQAGMLEVPTTSHQRLYGAETQDLRAALNVLADAGFDVYAIKPNDPACNEVNVYFARPGVDPRALEERLGLNGLPIYDGKHYWAIPVSNVEDLAETERAVASAPSLQSLNQNLQAEGDRLEHELGMASLQNQALFRRMRGLDGELASVQRDHAILALRNEELAGIVNALLSQADASRVKNEELGSDSGRTQEMDTRA